MSKVRLLLTTAIALLALTPFPASATIYTEGFEGYSTGSFTNPQLYWRNNSGTTGSIVTTHTHGGSKSFAYPNNVSGSYSWTVASTTGAIDKYALAGYIYMASSTDSSTCDTGTSNTNNVISGSARSHTENVTFCNNGGVRFTYNDGSTHNVFPFGTAPVAIWNTGWNTFYMTESSTTATVSVSINGHSFSYPIVAGAFSSLSVGFSRSTASSNHANQPAYIDDLTLYTDIDVPSSDPTFNDETRIISTVPDDKQVVSSTTAVNLSANGWLNSADVVEGSQSLSHGLSVGWYIQSIPVSVAGCFVSICQTIRQPLTAIVATTSQSFLETTTTPALPRGLYVMDTSINKANTVLGFDSFFGLFDFGYTTLATKRTTFVVGTTTASENYFLDRVSQPINVLNATSTAAALTSCLPVPAYFDVRDCVKVLFYPSYQYSASTQWSQISSRPPFSYWTDITTQLKDATTTATSTFSLIGAGFVATTFSTLINGLAYILWLLLLVWLFKRLSKWEFQA